MANNEYKFKLSFSADTKNVKSELASLATQLNKLSTKSGIDLKLTKGVREAQKDISTLRMALQKAVNVNTGQLDLSKFSTSLKRSNLTLEQLRVSMSKLGYEGQQAFASLARSIVDAEVPGKRVSALMNGLWTSLKNTAQWKISSSVLQGFTGAIREAYQYAQDLNKSLNNIRIVTGNSEEQMQKFAKVANKAAKELSTTTKEYARASLIFYQQGLNDAEVKKRTDAVIKMANVTGENAEQVSSYMTAIWNNFDDGSQSLEHYTDVITALGAATASSSEEIAGGLEKFVSIADTIGLSYEYATTALATVVAATRQSEDTVGTSFKTIFGRLQSLSLGETLDDDTTLTKYSNALSVVGVNIKQANGELKNMDDILDELGAKWDSLNSDQQTALANTVAGTRQYNNFIALMNSYSTAFQENLKIAKEADGTLNEQAEIYAESWEAARDRVTASAEQLYDSLINDKFFINITNFFAKFLNGIDILVDGLGGLGGILPMISALLMKTFNGKIAQSLEDFAYNFKMFIGIGQKQTMANKLEAVGQMGLLTGSDGGFWTNQQDNEFQALKRQAVFQQQLLKNEQHMTELQKIRAQDILAQNQALERQVDLLARQADEAEQRYATLHTQARQKVAANGGEFAGDNGFDSKLQKFQGFSKIGEEKRKRIIDITSPLDLADGREAAKTKGNADTIILRTIADNLAEEGFAKLSSILRARVEKMRAAIASMKVAGDDTEFNNALREYNEQLNIIRNDIDFVGIASEDAADGLAGVAESFGLTEEEARHLIVAYNDSTHASAELANGQSQLEDQYRKAQKELEALTAQQMSWAQITVSVAQGVMGLYSAFQQLSSVVDIMNDDTLSGWEKFGRLMTTILGGTVSLLTSLSGLGQGITGIVNKIKKKTQAEIVDALATKKNAEINDDAADSTRRRGDAADDAADDIKEKATSELADDVIDGDVDLPKAKKKGVKKPKNKSPKNPKNNSSTNQGFGAASAGAAIGKAGLVALGIALQVAMIAAYSFIWNYAENEAKKSEVAAAAMKEQFEETKAAYEDLKNSVTSYKDQADSLNTMIKGTLEWKDAIASANEEARALIKSAGLMYGQDYEIGADGLITFKDGVLEEAQKKKRADMNQAQATSMIADKAARDKRAEAENIRFQRESLKSKSDIGNNWGRGIGHALSYAGAGATAGAAGGWIGAIIGAAVGLTAGTVTGIVQAQAGMNTKEEDEALSKLQKKYASATAEEREQMFASQETLRQTLVELEITDTELINSLVENFEATKKLISTETALQAENIALQKQLLYLNDNFEEYFGKGDTVQGAYEAEAFAQQTAKGSAKYEEFKKEIDGGFDTFWIDDFQIGSDQHFKELVNKYGKGKYKISDTGGGDVTLEELQDDGSWKIIGEKNEYSKSDLKDLITSWYLASDEYLSSSEAVDMREENRQKYLNNLALLEGRDILDNSKEKDKLYQLASDFSLGKGVELSEFSRAEANKIYDLYKNDTSEFGKALYEAAANWETAFINSNAKANEEWGRNEQLRDENTRQQYLNELEMTTEAFDILVGSLGENTEAAERLADRALALTAALGGVNKVVKDNLDILLYGDRSSIEFAKAIGDVSQALSQAYGTTFDPAWLSSEEGVRTVIEAVGDLGEKGDIARGKLAVLGSHGINESTQANEETKGLFKTLINDLSAMNIAEGASLNDLNLSYRQQISDAISSNQYLGEDAQKVFENMGWDVATTHTGKYDENGKELFTIDFSNTKYVGNKNTPLYLEGLVEQDYNKTQFQKREVDKLTKSYNKLEQAKAKAYGKEKQKYIASELSLIEQQLIKQDELIAKEQEETALRKQAIIDFMNKYPELKTKVEFDENGEITNWDAVRDQFTNPEEIDKLINEYNSQKDEEKAAIEVKAELDMGKFDLQLEDLDNALELDLELSDVSIQQIERKIKDLGNNISSHVSRALLRESNFQELQNKYESVNWAYNTIKSSIGDNEPNAEQISHLKNYMNSMLEYEEDMEKILDEYQQDFSEAISQVNDDLEIQIGLMESLKTMSTGYKNIIDLLGKEMVPEATALLQQIDEASVQMSKETLQATQVRKQANADNLQNAIAMYNVTEGQAQEFWKAEMERLQQESLELEKELISNFEATLSAASQLFANNVSRIISEMENALANSFGSMEYMKNFYGQQKEIDDLYLDEYERVYEINKLLRNVSNSIDSTSSLSAKQKLKEIQDEINLASEKENELTQQDVDILQKKYELRLAEIALEDAQNAKTQVRLTKTETGAWSYVYTASQENIDKATQDYEDKLYALQKANKDYTTQWTDYLIDLQSSFGSGLNEILNMEFSSMKEQIEAIDKYLATSLTKLNAGIKGLEGTLGEDGSLEGTIFSKYQNFGELYSSISNGFQGVIDKTKTEIELFEGTVKDATSLMTEQNIDDYIGDEVNNFTQRSTDALNQVNTLGKTLSSTYTNLGNGLLAFQDTYSEVMENIKAKTDEVVETIKELIPDLEKLNTTGTIIVNMPGQYAVMESGAITYAPSSYDTGGYTGTWGPEGKMAILHEKEIVLNKNDTQNLLDMITMVNSILDEKSLQASIRSLDSYYNNQLSTFVSQIDKQAQALEQEVTIHAEFPNVTDHSEIEQAFENLVNMASQYANRK